MTTSPQSNVEPKLEPCPLSIAENVEGTWDILVDGELTNPRMTQWTAAGANEIIRRINAAYSRVSASTAPVGDEAELVFQHGADCAWERTTNVECEYKATHYYCPHPEHACTCPQVSGVLSDNPTMEEAEAYLRARGVQLEDVADAFIERLLQQILELKRQLADKVQAGPNFNPRVCTKCGHEERYSDNEAGQCEKVVLSPSVAGSGMARCGCKCTFPAASPKVQAGPEYDTGFEAGGAFAITTIEENMGHLRYTFDGMECCKWCALVWPANGWQKWCKGPHGLSLRAPVQPSVSAEGGITWSALLAVLERLKSKTRNPEAEWYHGWNAAIQCLINDINGRSRSAPTTQEDE